MTNGRLFLLQLARSRAAREDAMSTIRPEPSGWWKVRIGGRMRGTWKRLPTRRAAEDAVHEHYNAALHRTITNTRRQLKVRAKGCRIER
jgi:hypothetical protein